MNNAVPALSTVLSADTNVLITELAPIAISSRNARAQLMPIITERHPKSTPPPLQIRVKTLRSFSVLEKSLLLVQRLRRRGRT